MPRTRHYDRAFFYDITVPIDETEDIPLPEIPKATANDWIIIQGAAPAWRYIQACIRILEETEAAVTVVDPRLGPKDLRDHNGRVVHLDTAPPPIDQSPPLPEFPPPGAPPAEPNEPLQEYLRRIDYPPIKHPLMKHFEWPEFERVFLEAYGPEKLDEFLRCVEDLKESEPRTLGEYRKECETVVALLEEARNALLSHEPGIQANDGYPLESHLEIAIRQEKEYIERIGREAFSTHVLRRYRLFLHRKCCHAKARHLLEGVNHFYPRLGYGTLARLARIVFDDPNYDKRFAQAAVSERRREVSPPPRIQAIIDSWIQEKMRSQCGQEEEA